MTDEELKKMRMCAVFQMPEVEVHKIIDALLTLRAAVRREREARQIRKDVAASLHRIDAPEERLIAAIEQESLARAHTDRLVAGEKE